MEMEKEMENEKARARKLVAFAWLDSATINYYDRSQFFIHLLLAKQ